MIGGALARNRATARGFVGHLPRWLRFAVSKLFGLACVLLAMVIATFLVVRLIPGDPAKVVGRDTRDRGRSRAHPPSTRAR